MPTTVDYATYKSLLSTAADALGTSDYVGARRAALQAKLVALGLGASVTADGTSVQLLVSELGKLGDEITSLQTQDAMKNGGSRFIKTGLKSEGRSHGRDGVRHD